MSGLRHRVTRSEAAAQNMIHISEFHAFLARLLVELEKVVPPERRGQIASALERAAGPVEESHR